MSDNPIGRVPRLVVVQPEETAEHPSARLPVGICTHMDSEPRLSVIVKVTWSYATEARATDSVVAELADEQLPLSLDEPSLSVDAAPDELFYASDFAPRKARTDVLLVGHAHCATASQRIACRISVGDLSRDFVVVGQEEARAIGLAAGALEAAPGEPRLPVGPLRAKGHDDVVHGADFDYGRYDVAVEPQRMGSLELPARIVLEGLSRLGPRRTVELPDVVARATVEDPWRGAREVGLRVDTLWIDVDREIVAAVWRGDVEVIENGREVDRIVVWLDPGGDRRAPKRVLPLLHRGHVAYAVRELDLAPGAEPIPTDDDVLRMQRYRCWRAPAPEPTRTVVEYGQISAELAECASPEAKADVLERHGFDEQGWTVEERAWLEKMGRAALDGDASYAAAYSASFVTRQDELGAPEELARTFEDYLELSVAMVSTAEPTRVLEDAGLTLPAWMRLDRRFQERMRSDGELARRYRERMGSLEVKEPPEPERLR